MISFGNITNAGVPSEMTGQGHALHFRNRIIVFEESEETYLEFRSCLYVERFLKDYPAFGIEKHVNAYISGIHRF